MYQRVVIVGNLGRAPEMRYTPSGTPVANFPVATHRRWTDTDGNNQEETTWFRVTVFGRQAEVCNQFLEKGRIVLCEGEIRTSQYEDQQGITRYGWELRASAVKFLGGQGDRQISLSAGRVCLLFQIVIGFVDQGTKFRKSFTTAHGLDRHADFQIRGSGVGVGGLRAAGLQISRSGTMPPTRIWPPQNSTV